jgi:hypothetical protein
VTMADNAAAEVSWSARNRADQELPAVLDFFTEADFYFQTALPDQLSEAEIIRLLGDDTRLLLADGEPVGLWALRSGVSGHFQLLFRLRAAAPDSWWAAAYKEITDALLWGTETVRVTVPAFEFDPRLPRILRGIGLTDEGLLVGVVLHRGRRYGRHYFAQLWAREPPASEHDPAAQGRGKR